MDIIFENYNFATPFYALSVALRDQILRKPLGLEFKEKDLMEEWKDFHLGVFIDDQLCACLVLSPIDQKTIKMRQVAVHGEMQGKGIGSKLVKFSERFAKDHGFHKIELHARDSAIQFYENLDYVSEGTPFSEVGIKHMKMTKSL